jgi:hypothetical protein
MASFISVETTPEKASPPKKKKKKKKKTLSVCRRELGDF